jgi:hypothetical protein
LIIKHLEKHGEITARELTSRPFFFNCPHRAICNLRNKGYDIKDEWVEKNENIKVGFLRTQKVKQRYKRYYMEA